MQRGGHRVTLAAGHPLSQHLPRAVSAQQRPVPSPCRHKQPQTALAIGLVGTWGGRGASVGQQGPKAAGSWCFPQSVEVTELLAQSLKGDVGWVRGT